MNLITKDLLKLSKSKSKYKKYGLELELKGRLRGVRRARRKVWRVYGVSPSTLSRPHQQTSMPINTQWGVLNLKVLLNE